MDGDSAVGRNGDPVVALEGQGFAGNEDNVGAPVTTFHGIVGLVGGGMRLLLPAGAGAEEETGSFVRLATDVARANDAFAISHGKVEQTASVAFPDMLRQLLDVAIDALDCLQDGFTQDAVAEAVGLGIVVVGIVSKAFETVEEEGKAPLRVGAAIDASEPAVANVTDQLALDTAVPASYSSVVHEHQASAAERVAVALGQGAFGASADVGEDERRYRLAGQSRQVGTVPGGDDRGEDTRVGAEKGQ